MIGMITTRRTYVVVVNYIHDSSPLALRPNTHGDQHSMATGQFPDKVMMIQPLGEV